MWLKVSLISYVYLAVCCFKVSKIKSYISAQCFKRKDDQGRLECTKGELQIYSRNSFTKGVYCIPRSFRENCELIEKLKQLLSSFYPRWKINTFSRSSRKEIGSDSLHCLHQQTSCVIILLCFAYTYISKYKHTNKPAAAVSKRVCIAAISQENVIVKKYIPRLQHRKNFFSHIPIIKTMNQIVDRQADNSSSV